MKLKKSEKSKGVLLFANNTNVVDYQKIADLSSKLISKYLNLPTTIVESTNIKNQRYIDNSWHQWKNGGRWQSYELSPYDKTLLLDVDYFVFSNNLNRLFEFSSDYIICNNSITPTGIQPNFMGVNSISHRWATIFYFEKTEKTKSFFDIVRRVENNFVYYTKLFNTDDHSFRNDFAFTIADIIMNGYTLDHNTFLPWSMITIEDKILSIDIKNSFFIVRTEKNAIIMPKNDFHVIDKNYLMTPEFTKFVESVCE